MAIEIEVNGNAIELVVDGNRLTGSDAENHEANVFFGEHALWRSNHARWEIRFDKGDGSPFQGGNNFGPGTENDGGGGAAVGPGESPPLLTEFLVADQSDEGGISFGYTIHLTPNGSNTELRLDPRVRIFRRNRRVGDN